MKLLLALSVALLPLVLGTAAPEAEPEPLPSFRSGAKVVLGLTVQAPELWVLNPGIPFRVSFDAEALKSGQFSVDKQQQDFRLRNYNESVYIEVPVKLKDKLADGTLSIPLKIECGICLEDQSSCTFTEGNFEVKVMVKSTAQAGSKHEALPKGTFPQELQLPLLD